MSRMAIKNPIRIRRLSSGGYRVYSNGRVVAYHTTKAEAERQKRLLQAMASGWRPSYKKVKGERVPPKRKRRRNPVKVRKLKDGYRVKSGKRVTAKRTTKTNAERQRALLHAMDSGWRPTYKKNKKGKRDQRRARKNPAGYSLKYYNARGELAGIGDTRTSLGVSIQTAHQNLRRHASLRRATVLSGGRVVASVNKSGELALARSVRG